MTEIESVHPHPRITEDAVETDPQVLSVILCRHVECLSVPADTGLRILVSDGLIAVAVAGFCREREIHHPVVRQIHARPRRSIELGGIWTLVVDGSCLCEIIEVLCAASEILFRG